MSTIAKRPRGRPAQLSQERILDSALTLLRSVPLVQLTMQRLASELGTTSTSLYGYFNNQEDLFRHISERVMAGVDMSAARNEQDWRAAIRSWANAIRDRLLCYPHATELLQARAGQTPGSWFELSVPLIQALRRAGLTGHNLINSLRCTSRVVFGFVVNEHNMYVEQTSAETALQNLSTESRAEVEYLLQFLGEGDNNSLFAFTIERLIDGIGVLCNKLNDER